MTLEHLFTHLVGQNPILQGLSGGLFIALLNALGALLVFFWKNPPERVLDSLLGFAAGVMLTASFTSLILPGVEYGGLLPVVVGMVVGVALIDLADHFVPHFHTVLGYEGIASPRTKAVLLFIVAITLHNAPEGLAVGVAFGAGDVADGLKLMFAIGMQNIPEGLSVAISALGIGLGLRRYAVLAGIRSGLIEIPLALLGAAAVYLMRPLLPYAMGFAAGAMLYVISDEIVPETHRKGHERFATFGTMVGIIVMLVLDVALG